MFKPNKSREMCSWKIFLLAFLLFEVSSVGLKKEKEDKKDVNFFLMLYSYLEAKMMKSKQNHEREKCCYLFSEDDDWCLFAFSLLFMFERKFSITLRKNCKLSHFGNEWKTSKNMSGYIKLIHFLLKNIF